MESPSGCGHPPKPVAAGRPIWVSAHRRRRSARRRREDGDDGDDAERDRGQGYEAVALDEADAGEAERGGGQVADQRQRHEERDRDHEEEAAEQPLGPRREDEGEARADDPLAGRISGPSRSTSFWNRRRPIARRAMKPGSRTWS